MIAVIGVKVCVYQLLGHFLYLGDEVGEELRHVFLLAGVERLFVHSVGFTERPRVVRFPLTLLNEIHKIHKTDGQTEEKDEKTTTYCKMITVVQLIQTLHHQTVCECKSQI